MDPTTCDLCKGALDGAWCQTLDEMGAATETRCLGCDKSKLLAEFRKTGRLSTRLVEKALLDQAFGKDADADVLLAFGAIPPQIKLFEHEVWFGGLQDFAMSASVKGTSVRGDGLAVLCWTMCGRAMITIEDAEASVTAIADETSNQPTMGWRGIDATVDQAVSLLMRARALWRTGARPTEDRGVTLAVPGMGAS